MGGFAGQDPAVTTGGFVEKVVKKFIEISKTKSDRMKAWVISHSQADRMGKSDQVLATDQGIQDVADDIALAIYESLKEMNGAIVSKSTEDPAFWQYQAQISIQFNSLLTALSTFAGALSGDPYAAVMAAALNSSLATITPLSPAAQLRSHMEK